MGIYTAPLKLILAIFEPILLTGMLFAFWFASPARDPWLWLLALVPVVWVLRGLVYRRIWTRTPLDGWLLAFVLLALVNIYTAPYRRTPDMAYSFFVLMGRPLMGIALYGTFVEQARLRGSMRSLLAATLVLAAIITVLSLGASQWNSKSIALRFVTDALPRIAEGLAPFDARGGFNANEMAGALAFVCPFMGGLVAYSWGRYHRLLRVVTALLFGLLFLALFLGQSRFALVGTLIALAALAGLLIPARRGRWLAWTALAAITVFELLIVRDVFMPPSQQALAERDAESITIRYDIWGSALHILRDYPLTGVGLNMFRDGRVRAVYPVPSYTNPVLPHAHQEWLQIGADMGLLGLAVFIGLQAVVAWMLYTSYRRGDQSAKGVTAAVAAGLFAHGFFGLGDAITLWDRFAFLLWWLLGLGGAQAYHVSDKGQL